MPNAIELRISESPESLRDEVGRAIGSVLASAVNEFGSAHLVLTGGTIGIAVLNSIPLDAVEWGAVHVWWGDERFLERVSADRNCNQAQQNFLDRVALNAAHIHRIPSSDDVDSVQQAATSYAAELATQGEPGTNLGALPRFDLVLLGMGPDTHVASLFPGAQEPDDASITTWAVMHSPKPPPERVSLTFSAINSAERVWLLVSDPLKADALARVLARADDVAVPASRVHGKRETVIWTDRQTAHPGS